MVDVVHAYTLEAETYDDIDTEAFYINQYDLYETHLQELAPSIHGYVLDLGCGTGLQLPLLCRHATYTIGLDLTWALLKKAHQKSMRWSKRFILFYRIEFPTFWQKKAFPGM